MQYIKNKVGMQLRCLLMELALGSDTNLPLIYSIIIETASDKPLIDYHLKSTHFGETCQQGLQEVMFVDLHKYHITANSPTRERSGRGKGYSYNN